MTMTAAEAEKKIVAALSKAGYLQTRIKSDEAHVEVVGLGATAVRVSIPVADLSDQAVKDAVEAALKAVPKPEATPVDPNAPSQAPAAEDDDEDEDDPVKPAAKGSYKPIGKK